MTVNSWHGHCFNFYDTAGAVRAKDCVSFGRRHYRGEATAEATAASWQAVKDGHRWLSEWLQEHRQRLHRAIEVVLLADALLAPDTRPAVSKPIGGESWGGIWLTTHHAWLALAVLTMLADHAGKGLFLNKGSFLILPAQAVGAPAFYFLTGADGRPRVPRAAAVSLILSHAALRELEPFPGGELNPYTLLTIAVARRLLPLCRAGWPLLVHALLAASLVSVDALLGFGGLGFAYGCRAFLWAIAAKLQLHGAAATAPAAEHAHAARASALYWAAATAIHAHLTIQNGVGAVCRTRIAAWLCTALKCVSLPFVLTHAHLLRRYTFRRLAHAAAGSAPRWRVGAVRVAWALAHHSLAVYDAHMLALLALGWQRGDVPLPFRGLLWSGS